MKLILTDQMKDGFNTAYIDKTYSSNLAYNRNSFQTTTKKAARFSHPLRMSFCHVKNFLSA